MQVLEVIEMIFAVKDEEKKVESLMNVMNLWWYA